jgi:chromosome partitioning protein
VIIATANQKGGVAKTTTVVTLGHGLAMRGYQVLLVDLDPQGHIAISLGLEKAPGILRLLSYSESLHQVKTQARENLDILPSDKTTERAKRDLMAMDYRETVLTNALAGAGATYDAILLDTAPSLDVLHVSALQAASWLLIPTKLDAMAIDGVNEVLKSAAEINRHGGHIEDYRVLPTFYERVTRETLHQLQQLAQNFGTKVLPPIPSDTRVREAPSYGKTIFEYVPNSPALSGYNGTTGGYLQVIDRIEELING